MKKKDFLSITNLSAKEIWFVLDLAQKMKKDVKRNVSNTSLLGKSLVMIFEKPSLRTRLSFEIGIHQLGGHAVYLPPDGIGLGVREKVSDIAKVASSMGDMIMARTYKHTTIVELANNSPVSVINGLSDLEHPCQILADLLTILEIKGVFEKLKIAYFGDSENNVVHSLALASALLGIHFTAASPMGYMMKPSVVAFAKKLANKSGAEIVETESPELAAENADIIYTDTWVSMGEEKEKEQRLKIFPPFRVTNTLLKLAKKDAIFMHDLPAYRGNEVDADVIDGNQSVVFQQAENRLHVQKALMVYLFNSSENSPQVFDEAFDIFRNPSV